MNADIPIISGGTLPIQGAIIPGGQATLFYEIVKVGRICTFSIQTTFDFTGVTTSPVITVVSPLPIQFRPSNTVRFPFIVRNNDPVLGSIVIENDGNIGIYAGISNSPFTASFTINLVPNIQPLTWIV